MQPATGYPNTTAAGPGYTSGTLRLVEGVHRSVQSGAQICTVCAEGERADTVATPASAEPREGSPNSEVYSAL